MVLLRLASLGLLALVLAVVAALLTGCNDEDSGEEPVQGPCLAPEHGALRGNSSDQMTAQLDDLIATKARALGMESFSFLMGDEEGIRYSTSISNTSLIPGVSNPKTPLPVYSAGKWLVAAAIGAAVQAGHLAWDDTVGTYIPWWTQDENDQRAHITFQHLLSHTSGITASSSFLAAMGVDLDSSPWDHTYVGLWDMAYTLEDCAKAIYNDSEHIPRVPAPYRYGETHYVVAQYAAMHATGSATWQDFFQTYLAGPLGLSWEVTDAAFMSTGRLFRTEDATYTYGFFSFDPTMAWITGERIPNPDGGSQLVASACAFSRFLTAYLKDGQVLFGVDALDRNYTDVAGLPYSDGYALGHYLWSEFGLMHMNGGSGTLPVVAVSPAGKRFWVHIQTYSFEVMYPIELIMQVLPSLYELVVAPPNVNCTVCA